MDGDGIIHDTLSCCMVLSRSAHADSDRGLACLYHGFLRENVGMESISSSVGVSESIIWDVSM